MKNEKYYVGLDIGTDSVGYAVTNESYSLCKFKGEPMWGVTLFDEAQLAVDRRNFRVARRRLDRRQQRVRLLQELFAKEIAKEDANAGTPVAAIPAATEIILPSAIPQLKKRSGYFFANTAVCVEPERSASST